jgi:acyl CoA:acetate/3-ketoacid CoA transferase alpha subunit
MGRIVKIRVVDAMGTGAAGQSVMAGEFELTTSSEGITQALLDDGQTTITVNGVKAYEGSADALRPIEVFTAKGERVA